MHIGNGEWIVIDSCLDPGSGDPAALAYFDRIGVEASNVPLTVITHWDDDHVRGITRVVEACENATVAISGALCREDHLQFILEDVQTGASGTVDELRSVLRIASESGRLVFAQAHLPLHPRVHGESAVVTALSPSSDSILRGITELAEAAAQRRSGVKRRYRVPDKPNESSVVTIVEQGSAVVLLGGDLENTPNPDAGWKAVLAGAGAANADVVKVPHHGSEDAHHPEVWAKMVSSDSIAIVTPLRRGSNRLPTGDDVQRLLDSAGSVILAAVPSLGKTRLDRDAEKILRRYHDHPIEELMGWGHVRARRAVNGPGPWEVETDGDARRVSTPADVPD